MSDQSRVPGSRLGRLARLAAVGVRSGSSLLLAGDGTAAARHAAAALGTLRGLAAKVGQMASYIDGIVPEAQRDAYEAALASLRAAAPHSSPLAIRRLVEEELGGPIDRLFAEWQDQPFASASIGQVHRAVLADGREVAVKVQHPGIDKAVESDLRNAGVMEGMVSALGGRRFDPGAMLEVARLRFREELDYELEAQRMAHFARIHDGDAQVRIPAVIPERSRRRVLTSEFMRGKDFADACAGSAEERRRFAETLWRFVFKGNLVSGLFNADPHPGNYLFQEDGRIVFLDFGCVQPIERAQQVRACAVHRAALDRDEGAFAAAGAALIKSRRGRLEPLALHFLRGCFAPLFSSPYCMTRGFVADLVAEVRAMTVQAVKTPAAEFFPLPPEMLFMNRLQFGFYSVLARIAGDIEVDYAQVERGFWHLVDARGDGARTDAL